MKKISITKTSTYAAFALCAMAISSSALAQRSLSFEFSNQRPRLVVLLHGVTAQPEQDKPIGINSPKHTRYYWGIDEIQGLTGHPSEETNRIITPTKGGFLNYEQTPYYLWDSKTFTGVNVNRLAPVVFPIGWLTGSLNLITQQQMQGYITAMTKTAALPSTHVMVTYRDGSKHLMPQTGDAIDQIYETYQAVYGHIAPQNQPQIYLVGHSFGGVVARTIVTNPTGADLFGNKLTNTQRLRANFLRDRTVFITTLSSPHEGTLISDPAGDMAQFIKQTGNSIEKALAKPSSFSANVLYLALNIASITAKDIREGTKKALDAVAGERDCLQDLFRMNEYNNGVLNPDLARRGDGTLVPIYTTSGRTPGGMYFDRDRTPHLLGTSQPYDIIDVLGGGPFLAGANYHGVRGAFEAGALFATESILHRAGYGAQGRRPWGTSHYPFTDRVKSPYMGVGPLNARPVAAGINLLDGDLIGGVVADLYNAQPYTLGADGENDNDGFLGVESGHGLNLTGGSWYRILDPNQWGGWLPWEQDNHGSMMFNPGTGAWIHNELILQAGPFAAPNERISKYAAVSVPPKPLHNIRVELLQVKEMESGSFDWAGKPDFTAYVRVENQTWTYNGPDDTRTWNLAGDIKITTPSSVIPIRISVIDRDTNGNYDKAVCSTAALRDNLYIYFDTRTQKIVGDLTGDAGDVISTENTYKGVGVGLKFRITGN